MLRGQHDIDLPHQLVAQADPELVGGHVAKGAEMDLADRRDHGVDFAELVKETLDAGQVGGVDVMAAVRRADFDHFMALLELDAHGLPERTACADNDDFHLRLLRRGREASTIA